MATGAAGLLRRTGPAVVAVLVAVCGCSAQPTRSASARSSPVAPPAAGAGRTTATPSPTAAPAPGLDGCAPRSWRTVHLRSSDGVRLVAAETGSGRRGVVLAHESDGSLCNWVPYATQLARQGVRVLLLDLRGHGSSGSGARGRTLATDLDVSAAATHLRASGTSRIAFVGASAGGTAALVAADRAPGADAVASVSGPAAFGPMDAARAAPRLKVPVLFMVGALDRGFVPDARQLAGLTRARHELVVVPEDGWHGTAMIDDPDRGPMVTAVLNRFLLAALSK